MIVGTLFSDNTATAERVVPKSMPIPMPSPACAWNSRVLGRDRRYSDRNASFLTADSRNSAKASLALCMIVNESGRKEEL